MVSEEIVMTDKHTVSVDVMVNGALQCNDLLQPQLVPPGVAGIAAAIVPNKIRTSHAKTLVATLAAVLGSVGLGTVLGYTAPAIPNLNSFWNPFHLDLLQMALVVGIMSFGFLIGALIGGPLVEYHGRKCAIVVTTVAFTTGWVLVAVSPNVYCLCVGRFVTGACASVMDVAVPVYVTEIAAASVRGFMGSCYELGTSAGLLFVMALGCVLPWNWLAIACACVPAAQLVIMMPMPESPRWLLSKGRRQEALEALHWFHSDVTGELTAIEDHIRQNGSDRAKWRHLLQPPLPRALFVVIGLMFFLEASGEIAIVAFLVDIFQSAGVPWDPFGLTAIAGVVTLVANLICVFLADRTGRRALLLTSALGMTVSLAALGTFFCVGFETRMWQWLPIVSLFLYIFCFSVGFGPISFCLICELFPLHVRGLATSVAVVLLSVFQIIVTSAFPYFLRLLGNAGTYFLFAVFSFLGGVFVFFVVPETNGKTLEEIEEQLKL